MFSNRVENKPSTLFVEQNVSDLLLVRAEAWRIGVNMRGFNLAPARFVVRAEISQQVLSSHRCPGMCCAPEVVRLNIVT